MKQPVIVVAALLISSSAIAGTAEVQTDWSGGPGAYGPVEGWNTTFFDGDAAWRSIPGQISLPSTPRPQGVPHIIGDFISHPRTCAVGDMDGDGDMDVLHGDPITGYPHGWIYWWERSGPDQWISHEVTGDFYGAYHISTVDVDGDGDTDVIGAAYYGASDPLSTLQSERNGRYAWFENVQGDGTVWTQHLVGELFWGANYIDAGDLDGDGDIDLVGSSELTNGVYEQEGDITWFENLDGAGTAWAQHELELEQNSAEAHMADIDGDGDLDVVGGEQNRLSWWENLTGDADDWQKHIITEDLRGSVAADIGDIDNDGDQDVLSAAYNSNALWWWENSNGQGTAWTPHHIIGWPSPSQCVLEDVDGDGDLDAAWAATAAAHCAENVNGQGTAWDYWEVTYWAELPWLAFGDVNDDGRLDMVVTNEDHADWGDQLDWYDVSQFKSDAQLTSSVLDGGPAPKWDTIHWAADAPADTTFSVQVRASDDPDDLGPFAVVEESGSYLADLIDPNAQYLQYRVQMRTDDVDASPILREITVHHGLRGDVNDDDVVDINDIFTVLAAWGPCDGCPEDVNGDDVVDINDLFEVLANWT